MRFQQWDGTQWTPVSDWIATDQALVRPLVEVSAAKYGAGQGHHAAGLDGVGRYTPSRTKGMMAEETYDLSPLRVAL